MWAALGGGPGALGRSWALWGALWSLLGALCAVLCTLLVSSPLLDALLVDIRLNFGPSLDASTLDFARPYGTLATFFQNHCSPLQVLFGSLLGRLEILLGPSWDPLGALLPSLGALWAALGRLLGALGALLGALGHLLGASWTHLWCSWAHLGCQLLPKMGSGSIFHRFGLDSGSIWGSIWGRRASFLGRTLTSCRRLYMVREFLQETHIEIRSGFSFSPCSAAVRAQHIRRLPKGCRACQIQGTSA